MNLMVAYCKLMVLKESYCVMCKHRNTVKCPYPIGAVNDIFTCNDFERSDAAQGLVDELEDLMNKVNNRIFN